MKSEQKGKNNKRVFLAIFSIVLLIISAVIIVLLKMSASMGVGSAPVTDYDKRVEIWNSVPDFKEFVITNAVNTRVSAKK